MKRRNFIFEGSLALSSLPLISTVTKSNENSVNGSSFYYSQSGVIPKDRFIYSGLLKSSNPVENERYLNNLRANLNYRTQIKYASNDKFKVEFIKKVLEYFLHSPSLTIVIKKSITNQHSVNKISRAERGRQKAQLLNSLCSLSDVRPTATINQKSQYAFGSGKNFHEEISDAIPNEVKDRVYYEQDLLQLSSFITSMVRADMNADPINLINSKIISHIKSRANVTRFDQLNEIKLKIV